MTKRVLVTGAQGQLGQALLRQGISCYSLQGTTRAQLDLSHSDHIGRFFAQQRYDIVINCAAYTAVDAAEEDEALALQVNARAVQDLAQLCREQDMLLVHLSTDYVFDGCTPQPYCEEDVTNPINVYGRSKRAGELAIQAVAPRGIILRTSWLYGCEGRNFLTTMRRLAQQHTQVNVVYDQVGSPTAVDALARVILQIIHHPLFLEQRAEIYHYSHEGVASWYDVAVEIMRLWSFDCQVTPVLSRQYPMAAARPPYSVLNTQKIKAAFGLDIPHWRSALQRLRDADAC